MLKHFIQVHVGEYGVHWNFFFTLAAVSILTSIVNIHPKYCGIFGLFILIGTLITMLFMIISVQTVQQCLNTSKSDSLTLSGYQICLLCGLNEYLISNERTSDLISQNKEGIFSIFGKVHLYSATYFL